MCHNFSLPQNGSFRAKNLPWVLHRDPWVSVAPSLGRYLQSQVGAEPRIYTWHGACEVRGLWILRLDNNRTSECWTFIKNFGPQSSNLIFRRLCNVYTSFYDCIFQIKWWACRSSGQRWVRDQMHRLDQWRLRYIGGEIPKTLVCIQFFLSMGWFPWTNTGRKNNSPWACPFQFWECQMQAVFRWIH